MEVEHVSSTNRRFSTSMLVSSKCVHFLCLPAPASISYLKAFRLHVMSAPATFGSQVWATLRAGRSDPQAGLRAWFGGRPGGMG